MKTKYLFLLILLLIITRISHSQETGFPIIRNYTPKDFDNQSQIFCVMQSDKGIMYFGLGEGLMEYDGVSWHFIRIENQAIGYYLAQHKSGIIYVAANGNFGYLKADTKRNTYFHSLKSLIKDSTFKIGIVWSIKFTSEHVYFQTFDAIIQYNPAKENIKIFKADTNEKIYGDFVFQDVYYIQSNKKGIMKIIHNELKTVAHSDYFKNQNRYKTVLQYDDSTFLIPTRTEGLFLYKPEKKSIPQKLELSNLEFISENNIYTAYRIHNNRFVLGSIKKGAVLIDKHGKILQTYDENKFIQNNQIYDITIDKSQNLWFSLSNGISKSEIGLDLSYWDNKTGVKDNVESIIRFDGTIYFATHQKIYYIDKTNRIQEIQNLKSGQNWCFLHCKHLNLLLAGTSTGIFQIKNFRAEQIYKGGHATMLYQSKKNKFRIFSTDYPWLISLNYHNGKWIFEGKWNDINDDLRGMTEDENGELWIGTFRNGAVRITPDTINITIPKKIRYYTEKDGFASLKNIIPFSLKNKIVWGSEKGLYIYNSAIDKFEPFRELGEQFCNGSRDIIDLQETSDGRIWICPLDNKTADIGYLQPDKKGNYKWIYEPFRRIPYMSLYAFFAEPNGIVWIGGSEGIYKYDLNQDTKNYQQDFSCLVSKIIIKSDSVIYAGNYVKSDSNSKQLIIDNQFNSIKICFASPFFDQEERMLYSYKLDRTDKEWSKWSLKNEKEYTNLWEGKYTFRVKAKNIYDKISNEAKIEFIIKPPYYRTYIAYSIYFLLFIAFLYISFKLYANKLIKQKLHLETIVEQRTSEILKQKEEIFTKNTELESKNLKLERANKEISEQAEQLLIYSKELKKLSMVASKTDNAVLIMNPNGEFEYLNDGFSRLYGYSLNELIELKKNTIQSSSSHPEIEKIFNECVSSKKSILYESNSLNKKGEIIWTQTTLTPIIDTAENVVKVIAVDTDIRKLKSAELEIIKQNENIKASIRYAQTIQNAILPMSQNINFNHFIIYIPKDIVSGDFYFYTNVIVKQHYENDTFHEIENNQIHFFAVVDCTGHGVPGAFMSMIGSRLLSEIIVERHVYNTDEILDLLNKLIIQSLQQNQSENSDGMDLSIVRIEKNTNGATLQFSGARNNGYIVKNDSTEVIKLIADRRDVGGTFGIKKMIPFTRKTFKLNKDDTIYLFTDGIIDQNNILRKRFGVKKFVELISRFKTKDMQTQKQIIENELNLWTINTEQRDDITVMGIRI